MFWKIKLFKVLAFPLYILKNLKMFICLLFTFSYTLKKIQNRHYVILFLLFFTLKNFQKLSSCLKNYLWRENLIQKIISFIVIFFHIFFLFLYLHMTHFLFLIFLFLFIFFNFLMFRGISIILFWKLNKLLNINLI